MLSNAFLLAHKMLNNYINIAYIPQHINLSNTLQDRKWV